MEGQWGSHNWPDVRSWRLSKSEDLDMAQVGRSLKTVLEGFADFLREREFALTKHQPHLVQWVREFPHAPNRVAMPYNRSETAKIPKSAPQ